MVVQVNADQVGRRVILEGARLITFLAALVLSALLSSCAAPSGGNQALEVKKAIEACDPFMGAWRGDWKLHDESESGPLVAHVIALGKGTYEAKFFAEFDTRQQPMLALEGKREGRVARFRGRSAQGDAGAEYEVEGIIKGDTFSGTLKGDIIGDFSMGKTIRLSPTLGAAPPTGAVVLLDGKGFDQWEPTDKKPPIKPVQWKRAKGGAMEVKRSAGSIVTKKKFTDFKLHLEFRTPFMPEQRGQARGNSGVYLQGRYEVQVLDSYGLEGLDNECGGIYKVGAPLVNVCAPPMQWQTYDITFTAPRFDAAGAKTEDAIVTIVHNGVTIHDRLKIAKPTGGALDDKVAEPGGIYLQDHGNPVQFRNIWLVEL